MFHYKWLTTLGKIFAYEQIPKILFVELVSIRSVVNIKLIKICWSYVKKVLFSLRKVIRTVVWMQNLSADVTEKY